MRLCNCTLYFCVDNIFPSKETNLLTCKWDLQLNTCTCLRAKIHYVLLLLIKVSGKSLEITLQKFFLSMAEIVALECHRYLGHFSSKWNYRQGVRCLPISVLLNTLYFQSTLLEFKNENLLLVLIYVCLFHHHFLQLPLFNLCNLKLFYSYYSTYLIITNHF